MPKTAAAVKAHGHLPAEMTMAEINTALQALRDDLPGDPIGYIERSVATSERCECGSMHLQIDSPDLDELTRTSLHRLLATPFGDIVRESVCRQSDLTSVRFGWSGLDTRVPMFIEMVDRCGVRSTVATDISDGVLDAIIDALRLDLPEMMSVLDESLLRMTLHTVRAALGDQGQTEWKALIEQVMFAFSTPVRKYVNEYARRRYNGARVGAINCCGIVSDLSDEQAWSRRWFNVQVGQQLTPDC